MIKEFIAEYTVLEDGSHVETVVTSIAGRLTAKRIQGKLLFYDIVGDGMKVQIMSDIKNLKGGEEKFREIHALLKRGDIVGVTGHPGKSKKGELSIFPTDLVCFYCRSYGFFPCMIAAHCNYMNDISQS
jgi:lysyl-tRNA synthetase, class II